MINPFNPYYPAETSFFANRRRETEWLKEGFLASLHPKGPGPWNVAILGPWGIGKSSLVRRLQDLVKETEVSAGAVFLSCTTGYGSMVGFAKSLISAVREEILSLSGWSDAVRRELDRWSLEVTLPGLSMRRDRHNEAEDAANSADLLRSSLRRFWEQFLGPRARPLVVILDDAHLLQVLDGQALMILRAVFQDLQMLRARYALVITGPPGLFGEVRELAEPVTRFFEHMSLKAFELADVADAVRHPLAVAGVDLRVPDETVEWVWQCTEGHPYFVTFLMRDLVDAARRNGWRELSLRACRDAWPGIIAHLENDKFVVDWSSATPAERQLLVALAAGRRIHDRQRGLLTRLVRKGLVLRLERGQYKLYHPLFAEFVLNRGAE